MLRIIYTCLLLTVLLPLPAAHAFDVLGGCREVTPKGTLLLLDLRCTSDDDCWPDPDDVDLMDAVTGKDTGWTVSDMVWLDKNDRVLDDMPKTYPMRAVWDMSAPVTLPGKVRLEYDGEALVPDITPDNSCAKIPHEVFQKLGIARK